MLLGYYTQTFSNFISPFKNILSEKFYLFISSYVYLTSAKPLLIFVKKYFYGLLILFNNNFLSSLKFLY